MQRIDRLRLVPLVEMLQLHLHQRQRLGIEQIAQLGLAQKLAELTLVDGQRLRPSLRQWRIAVVDEICHVAKQQRAGERRRLLRVGNDHTNLALANPAKQIDERGDIEDIGKTLAICLEDHRK